MEAAMIEACARRLVGFFMSDDFLVLIADVSGGGPSRPAGSRLEVELAARPCGRGSGGGPPLLRCWSLLLERELHGRALALARGGALLRAAGRRGGGGGGRRCRHDDRRTRDGRPRH